jgi:TRAP transporter TAXI family solute receptor
VSGNFPTIGFQLQTEGFLANGGLKWSDVIPVPVSSIAEGVRAVIEGRSDTSTCGLGIPIVQELHARKGARFLPFDPSPEAVKRMYEKYSGYPFKVTPAPEYIGLEKEQYFWAFDIYFIGHKDLPDEAVYQIVKALWENYKEVGSFDPDLKKEFTPERFVSKEALIPYHPGAIKFYKEKGVWTGEMGKLQEALLAKKK